MTIEENHTEIWEYIKETRVGMLTTCADNIMHSRPMFLVQKAYEGVIWLFGDKDAHKMTEIRENPHVNLNFSSKKDGHYLSLSGIASLHHDGVVFDELWSDDVEVWFAEAGDPKGQAVLIRIDVNSAEVWDTNKSILVKAFEFAKAKITGNQPDLGRNKTMLQ